MKKIPFLKFLLIAGACVPMFLSAQLRVVDVDRTKYPDFSTLLNPDQSLLNSPLRATQGKAKAVDALPDHLNNADNKYFPPVFNQDGGSCGSASRISYMFSYELAAYRDLDASKPENYYPSHFVWLHTYAPSGQGKDEFVQFVGVPSAATYGGQTYSSLFGNQDTQQQDFGWMQGYDKWYEAMHNRMLKPVHFPQSIATEEGRNAVKRWLYNHNGDNDFHAGGICGIGVASGGVWDYIPNTETNKAIGVNGMWFVREWGTQVDHALTIVGYDDRIEFDLDKDGKYGEKDADEVGAWIIVNSWGNTWCNGGFIYCPYAFAGSAFKNDGNPGDRTFNGDFWWPEIYKVRKDYRPLRTIKLEMDYSRRSEIALSAGVSADLTADMPEKSIPFVHFIYAGDGNSGNSNPAPEIPMLGRWADGKLHTEPMEFGYDLTDLSAGFDRNMPLKYFFIVDTRSWAQGKGTIHKASIIDYENDVEGIETPFDLGANGVEIRNAGNQTIISVIVYGESYYAPTNPSFDGSVLSWQAPLPSAHTVKSYNIYADGSLIQNVANNVLNYTPASSDGVSQFSVSAVYEDNTESAQTSVNTPVLYAVRNNVINLKQSGFSIPNVFSSKLNQATIEFWIKPTSLTNWNQSGGPGWGTFMFHANANGKFTVGWDTSNRMDTSTALRSNSWQHVAMVINGNTITTYINGNKSGSVTSTSYSGVGGFGDLVFSANGTQNAQNATYDEIRIWNYARSDKEILEHKNYEYSGSILPEGLLAYFKSDTLVQDGVVKLLDCVGGNHATILNDNFVLTNIARTNPRLNAPADELFVSINEPSEIIYAGIPVKFSAKSSYSAVKLLWTAEGAGVKDLQIVSPSFIFKNSGKQTISVTAVNEKGETVTATKEVTVQNTPAVDASFTATTNSVPAGERVTFLVNKPMLGYLYEWSMPGADVEKVYTINAAASYQAEGNYTVTLTVTSPSGEKKSSSTDITVKEVAPVANLRVAPNVVLKGETTFLHDQSKYAPTSWKWHLSSPSGDYIINGQNSSFTPEKPGVYNVSLEVANSTGSSKYTLNRGLIVCNADSKNGLNFGNGGASVVATKSPFEVDQRKFTIEWWMNPGRLSSFCNSIGDEESTFLLRTNSNGAMQISVNSKNAMSANNYVVSGEWHHYAVTFSGGTATFYLDGQQISKKSVGWAKLPLLKEFKIGGTAAPMSGQIDEFRVWNTVLSAEQLLEYANAPIEDVAAAESEAGLCLYYSFNQNGGAVQDATSNKNHGERVGFGPDGDAWGLSKGVFSLNAEVVDKTSDITADYLKNYKKSFSYDSGNCVNKNISTRAFAIKDWTLENTIVEGGITTGVHVDKEKVHCFTVTTGWDGFASTLKDHKAFQTITLPAGSYTFKAMYDDKYEGQCGSSYVVVAKGSTLPNTDELENESLAHALMLPKSSTTLSNSVTFVLTEETKVSLGLLVNMSGDLCMTIQNFSLTRSNVEFLEADGANGYDLNVGANGYASLYLPYPVEIPEGVTAYVAKSIDAASAKVLIEPITDGIIPSRTGVILEAKSGEYHFAPSVKNGTASSLLIGVLKDTDAELSKTYYEFDGTQTPQVFRSIKSNTLIANHAYLSVTSGTLPEELEVGLVPTGIEGVSGTSSSAGSIYDLSGRRVVKPSHGIYIQNGKKVFVD